MLYSQMLEALLMALHYFLLGLDLGMLYMLQEIFLMMNTTMIFYFFSYEAGNLNQSFALHRIITIPLVIFFCIYAISMSIVAIVFSTTSDFFIPCYDWIWLYSASYGIFMGFFMLGIKFYINSVLKKISFYSKLRIDKTKNLYFKYY